MCGSGCRHVKLCQAAVTLQKMWRGRVGRAAAKERSMEVAATAIQASRPDWWPRALFGGAEGLRHQDAGERSTCCLAAGTLAGLVGTEAAQEDHGSRCPAKVSDQTDYVRGCMHPSRCPLSGTGGGAGVGTGAQAVSTCDCRNLRAWQARMQLRYQQGAATVIQSTFRMHRHRQR